MKKILAITFRDLRVRFASFVEWLFFLILPIVFTLVLSGGTGAPADNRVRLVVVDQANTSLSTELITALENSESVRPDLLSLDDAEYQFDSRRVSAMLIIPQGFAREALESGTLTLELRQQPNSLNALVAQRSVQAVISRVGQAVAIARNSLAEAEALRPFETDAARQTYFDDALESAQTLLAEAPDRLTETQGDTPDQIEYDPRANSSAGQLITWVFIPLIGLSELFAYERQKGTLRRILTTPTRKGTYLFGTIFGQVLIALGQMTLLVLFGILVMNLNWGQDVFGLAIMLVAGALAAAALGTMLGTFVKTTGQANGLSIMLGMVMALMGGCWYPLELFPEAVRSMVKVLPTTWAMQGLLDLVLRGQPWTAILPEAGVLLGFAAVFFVIGILRFKYE
ncbi:MAG: ABC transporter permease [Anaerolineales bacterium]|nr:ABC transporter permease [Anaerolineales bacterium]